MKQSLRLGRVAGIPVGAHWTVAVILVIITGILGQEVLPAALPRQPVALYWAAAVAGALLFVASLLGHELAHALVAKRNGVRVRSITLWMLGGVTELDGDPPDAGADLRIALAGPGASGALTVIFAGAAAAVRSGGGPAVAVAAASWLALMNGMLAVFNMLPGTPLDGGRVLRAVLWRRYRDQYRAALAAAQAGRLVGAGITVVGVAILLAWGDFGGLWLMLIGWFLISAASAEAGTIMVTKALAGLRVSDVMTPDPDVAPGWHTVHDFIANVAAHSHQTAFPVVDSGGALSGLVFSGALARIPPDDRCLLRVKRTATAVPAAYVAAPGDPAGPLPRRPPLGGEVVAVVLDQGRVVGLVTTGDLHEAVRQARLRSGAVGDRGQAGWLARTSPRR
jgi:Zn-dependent protease/CBS domain-containing protein